jgi:serine/threonine protein kinase
MWLAARHMWLAARHRPIDSPCSPLGYQSRNEMVGDGRDDDVPSTRESPMLAELLAEATPTVDSALEGGLSTESMNALLNQRAGDYIITERLGYGGMGIVYSAIHPVIGKAVAIKVLRPEFAKDPDQARRLFDEASAIARIQHRGIVDVFNVGQLPDGRHYLVMELLHGQSLAEVLARRKTLPLVEALELFDEVLAALGAAHAAGIVHRDLEPSNVFLVTQSDGATYAKLLDFGIAKRSDPATGFTPQTRSNVFLGTPEYVAPEQAVAATVGPYTDLYSAAVMLFEMLTGRLPFVANTPIELVVQHLESVAPAPSAFARGVPPSVDALVASLLEKDPARRPPSAHAVREAVRRLLDEARDRHPSTSGEVAEGEAFTLRLGTRFELGLSWITPALSALRRWVPDRSIHLTFSDSPELVRRLRSGQLDCAVTSARVQGEWLCRADLHEESYTFVGPPELRGSFDPSRWTLADVHDDLPLFRYLLDAHSPARGWNFARTELLGTIAAVRYRVCEGEAVAVLPSYFVADDLRDGRLCELLPGLSLERDQFRLLWRQGHPREASLQHLAAQLREIPLR